MSMTAEEQTLLRHIARDWLDSHAPVARLRAARGSADRAGERALWAESAAMGWTGVLVPETYGGTGLGFREAGILLEETGRTLAALPLLGCAVGAVTALRLVGSDEAQQRWLPQIAAGETIMALAIDGRLVGRDGHAVTAVRESGGWRLKGTVSFVEDAMSADVFLVPATGEGRLRWLAVPVDRLARRAIPLVDARDHGVIALSGILIGEEGFIGDSDGEALDRVIDRLRIGLAAEMMGMAQAAFDMTVEYLRVREQFDRPIGTFQALQHRAAYMLVSLEITRAAVEAALATADGDEAALPGLACLSKAFAAETLNLVSNETIQLHGGIGMTDEHDAGLYLKRARVCEALYGSASAHRARFATVRGF